MIFVRLQESQFGSLENENNELCSPIDVLSAISLEAGSEVELLVVAISLQQHVMHHLLSWMHVLSV